MTDPARTTTDPATEPTTPSAVVAPPAGTSHRVRDLTVVAVMLVALVVLAIVSAGTGKVSVPPLEVLGSLAHHFHLDLGPLPSHPNGEGALWNVRFPRIVLGLFVGAALGAAGCLLQGVLANPLAEPGIIGVSSGAAVGACLIIVLAGGTAGAGGAAGNWALAGAAFVFGLITAAAVYVLSLRDGSSSAIMLVLTGIASVQFGAAIAKGLFDVGPPSTMVWQPCQTGRTRPRLSWSRGSPSGTPTRVIMRPVRHTRCPDRPRTRFRSGTSRAT